MCYGWGLMDRGYSFTQFLLKITITHYQEKALQIVLMTLMEKTKRSLMNRSYLVLNWKMIHYNELYHKTVVCLDVFPPFPLSVNVGSWDIIIFPFWQGWDNISALHADNIKVNNRTYTDRPFLWHYIYQILNY